MQYNQNMPEKMIRICAELLKRRKENLCWHKKDVKMTVKKSCQTRLKRRIWQDQPGKKAQERDQTLTAAELVSESAEVCGSETVRG